MTFALIVQKPQWRTVFTIPQGTVLQKGRHGLYHQIVEAAGSVRERYGCYSWGRDNISYYCGSFARDYIRGNFKSNLHGRVHNYLQNHRVKSTGHKNTNLLVFENINRELIQNDVLLQHFTFESLQAGDDIVNFSDFSIDSNLVYAVEELLICSYTRIGQCDWNRSRSIKGTPK